MKPILLRVVAPMVHPVVAKPGDRLLVRPGTADPVLVIRSAPPNFGALLGHLVGGALEADDRDEALATLTQMLGRSPACVADGRRRSA
jgi:hypothetical protein